MLNASMTTSAALVVIFLILGDIFHLSSGLDGHQHQSPLQVAKQWKLFTYNFLPHAPVNDPNFYDPMHVLATGIAVSHDRIFIATPQLFSGISSTVNFVPKAEFGDSPVLQAFPDWSFSTTGRTDFNCSDLVLISSYRLRMDSCNRLWILDAGISRSLEDYEITCPPKILIVNLDTNQVVRRVDFPPEVLRGESLFTNLIIDETTSKSGTCDDVFVYISDTVEPAIVVYDSDRDITWRVSHPAMYPDPDFAQSEILNDRFILMDGIVGVTFDEKTGTMYFQPLATDRIFSVHKDVLRAGPLAQNQVLDVKLLGKKSSQGIGIAVAPFDGSLIFSPMSETAIASWNPNTNKQSVLAYDRDRLQFVADIITPRSEQGVIYAISSKFQRFFLKNLDPNEFNNRILRLELPNSPKIYSPLATANNFHQVIKPFVKNGLQVPSSPVSSFFTSSAALTPKHPYTYETVGMINYSTRNPFTVLNHGESFPPSKETRDTYQKSFLDSLSGVSVSVGPPAHAIHTIPSSQTLNNGYYYGRHSRSIKLNDESSAQ